MSTKVKIGELLVAEHLLSEKQLEDALVLQRERGGRIVEICIAEGYFDARQFLHFLANTRTTASIDLLNYAIPREVISLVPPHFAMKHEVLPIDKMGKLLTVGMACPLDTGTIEELTSITGLRVNAVLSKIDAIMVAIEKYYTTGQAGDSAVLDDSYFEKILGPTHGKQPEEAAPAGPEPLTAASASKSAPPPAAPPAKPEKPLSQDVLASLRRLSEDPTATLHDVYTLVKDCPPLTRALLAVAGSDVYDIGGQAQNLATALALVDKSGTAALAEHILAGTIEV